MRWITSHRRRFRYYARAKITYLRWLDQLSGHHAMPTRYTVWVKNGQLGEKLVVVCDAPDVNAAIQQALEQAARNWECGTDILSVHGIAEGDVNGGLQ